MHPNGQVMGSETAFILAILFMVGICCNWLMGKAPRYKFEFVMGAFVIGFVASGFVIGWGNAMTLLALWTAIGLPIIFGYFKRAEQEQENARIELNDFVKELSNDIKKEISKERLKETRE